MIAHSDEGVRRPDLETHVRLHPLLVFPDRPEVAGGEALAGMLRAGNAGSNTSADHIAVLGRHWRSCPRRSGPGPGGRPPSGAGPLRLGRGHPQVRRACLPPRGGVLVRLPHDRQARAERWCWPEAAVTAHF